MTGNAYDIQKGCSLFHVRLVTVELCVRRSDQELNLLNHIVFGSFVSSGELVANSRQFVAHGEGQEVGAASVL